MADTTNDLIAEARTQAFGTIQIAAFEKTNIGDDATAGVLFADADMIEKLADALIVSLAERDELRSQLAEWIADRADRQHGHSRWEGNPVNDTTDREVERLAVLLNVMNHKSADAPVMWTMTQAAEFILTSDWLAARKAEWQAEAFDAGYERAESDHHGTGFWAASKRANPYRALSPVNTDTEGSER